MAAATLQKCVFRNGYLLRRLNTPSCVGISSFISNHDYKTRTPKVKFDKHFQLYSSPSLHLCIPTRLYTTKKEENLEPPTEPEKLSLYQRFKQMYRDYWYVLVPVHLVTSTFWFGGFYYMAKSGVDIIGLLESIGTSEKWLTHLKESSMGYIAISYALYKIATPIRYAVTVGGTTISINYLQKWGYIKPVPSTKKLKMMFNEGKDNIMGTMREKRQELIDKADQLKGKTMDAVKEKTQEKLEKQLTDGQKIIQNLEEMPNVKKK